MALGDFDKSVVLSEDARSDVQWWLDNVALEVRHIDHGPFKVFLTTDASELGWGAVCESNAEAGEQQSTGGRWNLDEQREHINVLELKAGWLGIQTFCSNIESCHVKISMDNTTSVAYINHFGGHIQSDVMLRIFGLFAGCAVYGLLRHTYLDTSMC